MKKIYLLIALFIFSGLIAKSQCTVDTTNMQMGFSPADTAQPVIIQGLMYNTTMQLFMSAYVNDSADTVHILSTTIDTNGISGFPAGITYAANPSSNTIGSNGRQCFSVSGTTNAPYGLYPLAFSGFIHVVSAQL